MSQPKEARILLNTDQQINARAVERDIYDGPGGLEMARARVGPMAKL